MKTRTKENISGKVDTVKEKLGVATDKVSDATPDGEQVKQQARRAAGIAQENPLGLAVGAAAVGFLAGMLVPSTRVEDEKLGPMADQVKRAGQGDRPGGPGARQGDRPERRRDGARGGAGARPPAGRQSTRERGVGQHP